MSVLSPKKKNVYLDKVNENLSTFFRTIEKFQQNLNELSQLANGATVHINDIERILGNNDDEEQDDGDESIERQEQILSDQEKEFLTSGKLCELNQNLNNSIREIRQSWNTLEKQGAAISKSVSQLPKLIQLFLDTTKTDADLNDHHFRAELVDFSEQFPIIGRFYYELCLEIQVLLLDLSTLKSVKHFATTLEFLSSRFDSISVPLQIIRQIQTKLT